MEKYTPEAYGISDGQIPGSMLKSEEGLKYLGIINTLGNGFTGIYSVNRKDHFVEVYRFSDKASGAGQSLPSDKLYETAIRNYIEDNVIPEDQGKMYQAMEFDNVCEKLTRSVQFMVHYRVRRDGKIHYFYVKCARVGTGEDFENIVLGFANEDLDVRHDEMKSVLEPGGIAEKRKILVVEDNELNQEILKELLSEDYEILTAGDGEMGLSVLSRNYRDLSAILLDVCMPVCDGFEFLERIQDDVLLSSVPVIVTTGSNNQDDELRCLELGAVDFITKPYNGKIVKGRLNNVIKLRESAAVLSAIEYDELTGLYTRQAFLHHAKILMRFHQNEEFHVVVTDVKNFKMVNSIYGEKTGDEVLVHMSREFRKFVQSGLLARYGSDQFLCITYGDMKLDLEYVERELRKIADTAPIPNLVINCGIYQNVDKEQPFTIICDRALLAMKSIRNNYECGVAFYDDEMSRRQIRQRMMETEFNEAVKNREFVVYLQPKYNVNTERIAGAEALIRWKKPDGTMVSPGEFIPLYEKDGLIVKLDEYVFRCVCENQKQRMDKGERLIPISVNLSRASLHHDRMIERYVQIVKETGIPFETVPIELTETAALYNYQIKILTEQLVEAGFQLHMDDFGSGYSSLTSLNMLPFDVLKLDKSLIDYINQFRGKQVVQHVIALAHGLGMKVLAEGVEEKEQVEALKEMECDEIQGFYYSRPQPYEVVEEMLAREEQ